MTQSASKIQTYLVENQSILRDGLQSLLELEPDIELIGTAPDAERALEDLEHADVKVIIMDTDLPGMGGIEATRLLKEIHPELRVIILSSRSGEDIEDALGAGATGYLTKSCTSQQLIHAIRETARSSLLTRRQIQILTLVAGGLRYQDIARELFVSRSTVNREIRNILDQLEVADIAQAIYEAHKKNLI